MESKSYSSQLTKFLILAVSLLFPLLALFYRPSINSEILSDETKEIMLPKYTLPFKELEYKNDSDCQKDYKRSILGQFITSESIFKPIYRWRGKTFCTRFYNRSEISLEDQPICEAKNGSCWSNGVCFLGSCPISDFEISNSTLVLRRGPNFISDLFILLDNRTVTTKDLAFKYSESLLKHLNIKTVDKINSSLILEDNLVKGFNLTSILGSYNINLDYYQSFDLIPFKCLLSTFNWEEKFSNHVSRSLMDTVRTIEEYYPEGDRKAGTVTIYLLLFVKIITSLMEKFEDLNQETSASICILTIFLEGFLIYYIWPEYRALSMSLEEISRSVLLNCPESSFVLELNNLIKKYQLRRHLMHTSSLMIILGIFTEIIFLVYLISLICFSRRKRDSRYIRSNTDASRSGEIQETTITMDNALELTDTEIKRNEI